MKKICIAITFLCFLSQLSFGQEWKTNFKEAKQMASKNNENIVLVFQGSDWCAPCIKLDREVFSTEEFQRLSKDHFIMMQVDFPRKKTNKLPKELAEQNNELAEKYNKSGFFPLVVLLNKEENVLGKMGYEKLSPTAYFKKLRALEN